MNGITLVRGQSYPLLTGDTTEGARVEFLRKGGNILQVILPNMSNKEEKALRYGIVKAGFLYRSGALLWLFQFYGDKGPLLTLDAPFDVRIIPADDRQLYDIDNSEQRLVIELHAIDDQHIVRGLRALTMPNELTLTFLSAVQEQLFNLSSGTAQFNVWMQHQPHDLIKTIKTWTLGT